MCNRHETGIPCLQSNEKSLASLVRRISAGGTSCERMPYTPLQYCTWSRDVLQCDELTLHRLRPAQCLLLCWPPQTSWLQQLHCCDPACKRMRWASQYELLVPAEWEEGSARVTHSMLSLRRIACQLPAQGLLAKPPLRQAHASMHSLIARRRLHNNCCC